MAGQLARVLWRQGRLRDAEPFPAAWEKAARVFGFTALGIGLTLIALICYAMIFGYQ